MKDHFYQLTLRVQANTEDCIVEFSVDKMLIDQRGTMYLHYRHENLPKRRRRVAKRHFDKVMQTPWFDPPYYIGYQVYCHDLSNQEEFREQMFTKAREFVNRNVKVMNNMVQKLLQ